MSEKLKGIVKELENETHASPVRSRDLAQAILDLTERVAALEGKKQPKHEEKADEPEEHESAPHRKHKAHH